MGKIRENGRWRFISNISKLTAWLIPGIGVKRWLILILAGTTMLGVGLGIVILEVYRTAPETWWLPILSAASLRFLARPLRALIFGGIGIGMIAFGIWKLNLAIIRPFIQPGHHVADTLRLHKQRERGPRIVAIGGGHGLAALLRGLKAYTHNITAIVTVADDGGSSGRLRKELGILPPGDIRNCLAALSNDEALLGQLFQYRIASGDSSLEGHSFGNLFISALAEVTGSFEEAVAESGRVLGVHGRVLPSTLHDVRLSADVIMPNTTMEVRVEGESKIPLSRGRIRRVWLEPSAPPAFPRAIHALLNADLIILGPGSLYTSILPNLLVPDLAEAVKASRALKLFICNVATQPGETDHFSCGDHLRVMEEHIGSGLFDLAIVNQEYQGKLPDQVNWVRIDEDLDDDFPLYRADLIDSMHPWRHDSQKLAQVVMDLYSERTGPLVE
ncbi:MAG TPA: gluconeogenesis factor YvcK family protein [Anaerolineales bacterium]|nr:gluconeogenesis factor YvcK family protein [Anaerolineales bacterium]